jgi:hypothetical protein
MKTTLLKLDNEYKVFNLELYFSSPFEINNGIIICLKYQIQMWR